MKLIRKSDLNFDGLKTIFDTAESDPCAQHPHMTREECGDALATAIQNWIAPEENINAKQ